MSPFSRKKVYGGETLDYQHQAGARAPIDAGKLIADNGKIGDYRYYLRVVEWCFCNPHMQASSGGRRRAFRTLIVF